MSDQSNCVGCDESPGSIFMSGSVLVSKMFQEVTGLKVQQHYTICKACQQELRSCYNFRRRCHEIFSLYSTSPAQTKVTDHHDSEENLTKVFANPLSSSSTALTDVSVLKTEQEKTIVTFADDLHEDELYDETYHERDYQSEDESQHYDEINMPESEEDDVKDGAQSDPDYEEKYEKFQCQECPKTFARRPQLVVHMSTHRHHTIFSCPRQACNSSFNVSHRLIRHLRNVHDADEDEVEETRESIKNMRPMRQATVKIPVPEGKVQCGVCLKVLANKRYLKEHMELQHLKTAKYSCTHPGCKKRFKIWSLYEMHMKKHNGQHDFKCQFCGKGYVQRKIYNSHLRNSHQVTQEEIDRLRWSVNGAEMKDNKCGECKLEFKTPHKLFEHMALVHGEGKRYICDICGKAFFSKAFLSSHQKYHKGVKSRKCTKCPSAFTEDKGLRTHLRRVHHMTDEEVYALGILNS